jgi:hypothetical protein
MKAPGFDKILPAVLWLDLMLLLVAALAFRVIGLDHLPGVNGDEAWYGVQAGKILAGRPTAWTTPTGLMMDPFLIVPELLLLSVAAPGFGILRVPTVLAGVLTVVLAYVLGTRVLDRTTALLAAVLLAASPIAIAYSRIGWDPSLTPLFSLLALSFALRGNAAGFLASMAACLVVHMTNIFLFPVLLPPLLVVALRERSGDRVRQWRFLSCTICATLLMGLAAHAISGARGEGRPGDLFDLDRLGRFLAHYGRLISGVSAYEYIAGPVDAWRARLHDRAFWCVALPALAFGLRPLARARHWGRIALAAGLVAGLLSFYVVAGPDALRPHYERYGMFLVVPTAFAISCLLKGLFVGDGEGLRSTPARTLLLAASVLGWVLLNEFRGNYFGPIRGNGGESHRTFRTAAIEPKQQAYSLILDDLARRAPAAARGSVTTILAEDWWLFQPLLYLAQSRPDLRVISLEDFARGREFRTTGLGKKIAEGAYFVGFHDGPLDALLRGSRPEARFRRWCVRDYSGRPLLSISISISTSTSIAISRPAR